MAIKYRKIRMVNPHRKPAARPKRRTTKAKVHRRAKKRAAPKARRKNPIYTVGFLNPGGRRMKKKIRRRNPSTKSKRRSNPSIRKVASRGVDLAKLGAFAFLGFMATRHLPQLALKGNNRGIVGYFANGLIATLMAAAAGKFAGKDAAKAVLAGGGLYTVDRIISEQTTDLGKALSLSGIGDVRAAGTLAGMRGIRPADLSITPRDRQGRLVPQPWLLDAARNEARTAVVAAMAQGGRMGAMRRAA